MKILVVGDTHGYNENLMDVIVEEEPFDMMIHCGDLQCEPYVIRDMVDCTLHMVAGNNDYDPELSQQRIFDIGRYKALLTHGHRNGVYGGYDNLYYLGVENHVDFVFFGHTHVPVILQEGPVTLINPGSLTYPRQSSRKYTYVTIEIEDGKKPVIEMHEL